MSDPYRDGGGSEAIEAPRDGGIVGDVIAQFADPLAFYRELVQNSIDAGSPDIAVDLSYDGSERKVRVAVRDRGEGMTREIIENQLLVLFRSTKESVDGKIGKFGVGFASVLSPSPDVVIVTTVRDGKRLTLHLYRDLSYELFDGGRATQAGTTVELEIGLPDGDFRRFADASETALVRWCRHASVPIELTIRHGGETRSARIDRPLAIADALVEVRRTYDDNKLTVVAAVTPVATPYVGFFNHGLMLHEAGDLLGMVSVKIQDSRLGHTISRDDVRRDRHFDHAVAVARELVEGELRRAVTARLRELVEHGDRARYLEVVDACVRSGFEPTAWPLPLVEPLDGRTWIERRALDGTVWTASASSELTVHLVAKGTPVIARWSDGLFMNVVRGSLLTVRDVEGELTAVNVFEAETEHDVAMLEHLRELLDAAHRSPAAILLAVVRGVRENLMSLSLPTASTRVVGLEDARKSPFSLFGRRTLVLSAQHPQVAAARRHDDPTLAAAHLARAVLLQFGLLDADRSETVLEEALDRIGVTK